MVPHRIALVAGALLLAAACGAQDDEPGAGESAPQLDVAATDLGEVLVDGEGFTLYAFVPDPPNESVCAEQCAQAWPPLLVDGEPAVSAQLDEDLVGTTQRDDGSAQVTYAGMPLYTWISDDAPGDTTGQGVEQEWYVVSPQGEMIVDAGDQNGQPAPEEAESEEQQTQQRDGESDGIGY